MRTSTFVVLAVISAASPTLAAPHRVYYRDVAPTPTSTPSAPAPTTSAPTLAPLNLTSILDSLTRSGAIHSGLVKDILTIGNDIINGTDGTKNLSTRDDSSSTNESGALNLGLVKDIFTIGHGIVSGADGIEKLLSRDAPTDSPPVLSLTDESGALNLGLVKDIVSIGSSLISGADGIKSLFSREELEELLARDDQSGAFSLGDIFKTAFSLFTRSSNERRGIAPSLSRLLGVLPVVQNSGPPLQIGSLISKRDVEELLARRIHSLPHHKVHLRKPLRGLKLKHAAARSLSDLD